jgi:hypothetical protein
MDSLQVAGPPERPINLRGSANDAIAGNGAEIATVEAVGVVVSDYEQAIRRHNIVLIVGSKKTSPQNKITIDKARHFLECMTIYKQTAFLNPQSLARQANNAL